MSQPIYGHVTLSVQIHNQDELRRAAADQAESEGMSLEEWESIRQGPADDLQMLLDPGAITGAGIEILESAAALDWVSSPLSV